MSTIRVQLLLALMLGLTSMTAVGCSSGDSSENEASSERTDTDETEARIAAANAAGDEAVAMAKAAADAAVAAAHQSSSKNRRVERQANANNPGSDTYCSQLASIGRTAFNAKQEGHGIDAVVSVVRDGLAHDRRRQTAAEGVVLVIYGDSSISSGMEAYSHVYEACRRNS